MKRRDAVLIGALLFVSLALLLLTRVGQRQGAEAVVRVEGVETARYSLAVDGEYTLNGGTNTLRIENGRARMIEADCPDKYCIRQGTVSRTNQTITCLPNRLTVTIEGGEEGVEIEG